MTKIIIGLLLVPFCFGFTWELAGNVFSMPYKADLPYYFTAGVLAYLTLHFLFRKPLITYVLGHELTHAFFAVLFGGSVKSLRATERGGQVTITKSNFIITLAPYFFPLYTFITLMLYMIMKASDARAAIAPLIFIAGATFSFHLVLTSIFLRTDQKDISEYGAVFSYPLIYLFNVVFSALLIHLLLAQKNGFLDFLLNGIITTLRLLWFIFDQSQSMLLRLL